MALPSPHLGPRRRRRHHRLQRALVVVVLGAALAACASTSESLPSTTSTSLPSPEEGTGTTIPTSVAPGPTEASTGPRVADPVHLGDVDVSSVVDLTDVVVDSIIIRGGGQLTATNVRVTNSIVVLPEVGAPITALHLSRTAVDHGMTVNVSDSEGNLYWDDEVPVDIQVEDSWIRHPQGSPPEHTEALAGFGWPAGATFTNTTFVQLGPFNNTATATINWHGADSTFDGCHFRWDDGVAAYYTVYVEGRNNVVENSFLEKGLADYVFPDSDTKASYLGNTDDDSGAALRL